MTSDDPEAANEGSIGYLPDRVLVAVPHGGDPQRDYVLVCLLCPADDHEIRLYPPNSTGKGYPTLGTLAWVAGDHWRDKRHPGWKEHR